jgi:hypothetical protein
MVALAVIMFLPLIMADAFLNGPSTTFVSHHKTLVPAPFYFVRGGATTATDSQEDIEIESSEDEAEDESEDEEEEEEKEEGFDSKLVKAAQTKAATVKTKMAKAAVQAAIATTVQPKVKKSSSKSLLKLLHIPYIIRACLNPFTFVKMTRAYFGSLVQLDYLNDNDSSKDLRSALQEKAKSSGGTSGGGTRGKKKFKPGKAKVSAVGDASNRLQLGCRSQRMDCPTRVFSDSVGLAGTQYLRLRKEYPSHGGIPSSLEACLFINSLCFSQNSSAVMTTLG